MEIKDFLLILGVVLLGLLGVACLIAVLAIPLWGAIYLIGEIIKSVL